MSSNSRTDRSRMSEPVWSIAPIAPCAMAPVGLRPKTLTLPLSGGSRPSSMSIVVDLPAPFGPRSATVSPARISTSMPRTACTGPPGEAKDFVSPWRLIVVVSVAVALTARTLPNRGAAHRSWAPDRDASDTGRVWIRDRPPRDPASRARDLSSPDRPLRRGRRDRAPRRLEVPGGVVVGLGVFIRPRRARGVDVPDGGYGANGCGGRRLRRGAPAGRLPAGVRRARARRRAQSRPAPSCRPRRGEPGRATDRRRAGERPGQGHACRRHGGRPGCGSIARRARLAQLGVARAARDARRDRPGAGPADHRLPHSARRLPVAGGARPGERHRPGAAGGPARPRHAVTAHTRLVLAATVGLAAAALGRPLLAAAAVLVGDSGRVRAAAIAVAAVALLLGSARVAALDRRTLAPGHVRGAIVVVTGAAT